MSRLIVTLLLFTIPTALGFAAEQPKRARPPQWSPDVLDAFFDDAREQLSGFRPAPEQQTTGEPLAANTDLRQAQPANAATAWSALVDSETLVAEIKRINNLLTAPLQNPASFQGGGNLICRREFGLLSVLFSVIEQFEADEFTENERWRRSAKLMQTRCFKTGQNCKVVSDQSFTTAQQTHALLIDLLRGQAPGDEPSTSTEPLLVDRSQLMQSMEIMFQERLTPVLANSREFRRRSQLAAEQAQLLAVLAKLIQQEGYEYADDDGYLDEARQLREASSALSQAAQDKNYEAAREAAGRVSQSCSNCHEGYRG